MTSTTTIKAARELLTQKAELLGALGEILRVDPGFADEIRRVLPSERATPRVMKKRPRPRRPTPEPPAPPKRRPGRPADLSANLRRVVEFLGKHPREWTSTPDILKGAGVSKAQFFRVVEQFGEQFERQPDPEFARRLQWRIKAKS